MIAFPAILLRLCLAIVFGALIGLERESRNHEAGLRTNALVAFGCALFTIISSYGFLNFLGMTHVQVDPTRIASYIVAGIGFLGAGAIFRQPERERIKGLTTAAAIWAVAAIGMACGAGLLWEAAVSTVLVLIVLVGMYYVELQILPRTPEYSCILQIEMAPSAEHITSQVYDICSQHDVKIEKLEIHNMQAMTLVTVTCKVSKTPVIALVVDALRALPGCHAVNTDMGQPERKTVRNI